MPGAFSVLRRIACDQGRKAGHGVED
jgi:hypothetical protein